jgi:hypothetical protein
MVFLGANLVDVFLLNLIAETGQRPTGPLSDGGFFDIQNPGDLFETQVTSKTEEQHFALAGLECAQVFLQLGAALFVSQASVAALGGGMRVGN